MLEFLERWKDAIMGGSNQGTLTPPSKVASPSMRSGTPAAIRFHEAANGNFHFHDDGAGKKVEVPAADFVGAWNGIGGLSSNAGDWAYTDPGTGLVLSIRTFIDQGKWDVEMSIGEPTKSTNFEALTKLVTG